MVPPQAMPTQPISCGATSWTMASYGALSVSGMAMLYSMPNSMRYEEKMMPVRWSWMTAESGGGSSNSWQWTVAALLAFDSRCEPDAGHTRAGQGSDAHEGSQQTHLAMCLRIGDGGNRSEHRWLCGLPGRIYGSQGGRTNRGHLSVRHHPASRQYEHWRTRSGMAKLERRSNIATPLVISSLAYGRRSSELQRSQNAEPTVGITPPFPIGTLSGHAAPRQRHTASDARLQIPTWQQSSQGIYTDLGDG